VLLSIFKVCHEYIEVFLNEKIWVLGRD